MTNQRRRSKHLIPPSRKIASVDLDSEVNYFSVQGSIEMMGHVPFRELDSPAQMRHSVRRETLHAWTMTATDYY